MVFQDINRWHNWQYLNLLRLVVCLSLNAAHVPSGTIRRLAETSIVVVARHTLPYIINNKLLKKTWQSMSFHFKHDRSHVTYISVVTAYYYNLFLLLLFSLYGYFSLFHYIWWFFRDLLYGTSTAYMVGVISFCFFYKLLLMNV